MSFIQTVKDYSLYKKLALGFLIIAIIFQLVVFIPGGVRQNDFGNTTQLIGAVQPNKSSSVWFKSSNENDTSFLNATDIWTWKDMRAFEKIMPNTTTEKDEWKQLKYGYFTTHALVTVSLVFFWLAIVPVVLDYHYVSFGGLALSILFYFVSIIFAIAYVPGKIKKALLMFCPVCGEDFANYSVGGVGFALYIVSFILVLGCCTCVLLHFRHVRYAAASKY